MSMIKNVDSGIGCMIKVVNGIGLTSFDFGDTTVRYCQETGEVSRAFVPKPAVAEILEKYHITEDGYREVCEELVQEFAGWNEARGVSRAQAAPAARASQLTDIAEYRRRSRRGAGRRRNAPGKDARRYAVM